jgi:hypothetical protein
MLFRSSQRQVGYFTLLSLSSFVLEMAYIEGGAQLLGGLIGSLGVRDKPAHLRREGSYFSLLDSIST